MSELFTGLAWLPPAQRFNDELKGLRSGAGPFGAELRRIATQGLSLAQLQRLGTVMEALVASERGCAPLLPLRLGVLGDGTLDFLGQILPPTGARHSLLLDCICAPYGQAIQTALDPHSALHAADCDVVLVALDYRSLPLCEPAADGAQAAERVAASVEVLRTICRGLRENGRSRLVIQTLAAPPEPLFGSFDALTPGAVGSMIARFNAAVAEACQDPSAYLLDTAALASTVGLAAWHAPAQWQVGKLPFALNLAPLYADHVCRLLAAIFGKARRALVLDLDNTLWGGVVGDDGMENLVLGAGDATGEAFLAVQRLALDLRRRGVVLAVCSKNNDDVARAAFRSHPEMLLKEEHIAVFRANWQDKPSNIRAIAEELALGLDALVFLDDNPVEREMVRSYLPEVATPELPDDPALYARTLAAAGYFEAVAFSDEDRARAEAYQANARRKALQQSAGSIDEFLAGLGMHARLQPFDALNRARIAQLVSKSNQFNLTTRRYSEAELQALETDPDAFTLQVRLEDRLGDNGMISVAVCRAAGGDSWEIEAWLMSCRVLGRGVERLVLRELVEQARRRGVQTLVGVYRPSPRNALVRGHYEALGFSLLREVGEGETHWTLSTTVEVEAPWFAVSHAPGPGVTPARLPA